MNVVRENQATASDVVRQIRQQYNLNSQLAYSEEQVFTVNDMVSDDIFAVEPLSRQDLRGRLLSARRRQ